MAYGPDSADPIGIADGYTQAVPFTPPDEDRQLVSNLQDLFQKCERAKSTYEWRWDLYRSYLKSDQQLYRDVDTHEIIRVSSQETKRLFSLNNQFRVNHRSLVGKLTRSLPSFTIVPATADEREVYGAHTGDAYLSYFRRREKLDIKYAEMQSNVAWCGNAVSQLIWDPRAGRTLSVCPVCQYTGVESEEGAQCPQCTTKAQMAAQEYQVTAQQASVMGMPMPPPVQQPIGKLAAVTEGDACVKVHDPRNVFVEAGIKDPDKLTYLFVRTVESIHAIRKAFPILGMHVTPQGAEGYISNLGTSSYNLTTDQWTEDVLDDHAMLYEYHECPTEVYPHGRVIWMCNSIILEEKESPYYRFKRLPFFWNFWVRNPGEFYGESPAEPSISLQRELNENITNHREHEVLTAQAKVLSPMGNAVGPDDFKAVTRQVIQYNHAFGPPHWMAPPILPQGSYNRKHELIEDIRQQWGVTSEESMAATGDASGRAKAISEAESDQTVGPIVLYNMTEWGELNRCLLILAKCYYGPDRKFTVPGEDGLEVYSFEDMNLEEGWDLQLEVDDGFSKNGAVRQQQVMNWAAQGLYMDQRTGMLDVARVAKSAKIKVPGVGIDITSREAAAATALLKTIERHVESQGQTPPPQIQAWDDPLTFSAILQQWLRTRGRKANPQTVQAVAAFWTQYTMIAQGGMQPGAQPGGAQASTAASNQSAPGGSPNQAAPAPQSVSGEAGQRVQQADRQAESQARTQSRQES